MSRLDALVAIANEAAASARARGLLPCRTCGVGLPIGWHRHEACARSVVDVRRYLSSGALPSGPEWLPLTGMEPHPIWVLALDEAQHHPKGRFS